MSELRQPDQLSELALRVAGGEDHRTEFKSRFPDQARDLAKEIAAFASSNDGLILIGVEDDGTFIGIEDAETRTQRDGLVQRVQGICANTIKPPVTPRVEFVTLEGARVLVIDVPKGTAPLYYVHSVAYVRHLTSARAAEPQEVIDLILAWAKRESGEPSAEDCFLSGLVQCLTDVLVNTSEVEIREIDPWGEEVRRRLASNASRLRDLALSAPTKFEEFPEALEGISELLDEAAHQGRGIGWGWNEYRHASNRAQEQARAFKAEHFDKNLSSPGNLRYVEDTFAGEVKAIAKLASRAESMIAQHRLDEVKREASEHGRTLLTLVMFGIGLGGDAGRAEVEKHARLLRDFETRPVFADGGKLIEDILQGLKEVSASLRAALPVT